MRFKTKEDFDKFCDTTVFCVCRRLMTGMHMQVCNKLRIARIELEKRIEEKSK